MEKNSFNLVKAIGFYKLGDYEKMREILKEIKEKEKFLSNEEKLIFYYLLEILDEKEYKGKYENLKVKLKASDFVEGFI